MTTPLSIPAGAKRLNSNYYVEGYATTFDKPYCIGEYEGVQYYEMVERGALDGADVTDVIFQYDHTGKVFARQSNKTLIIEPDAHGIFTCADLSMSNGAKDMYEEIRNGLITKMSWAFIVLKDFYDRATHTRIIQKVKKIYDVSAVSLPANDGTSISARSYFVGVNETEKREALARKSRILLLKLKSEV